MNLAAHQARWPAVVTFALVGLMVFGGLARFGIWDPWELEIAEAARNPGVDSSHTSLSLLLISASFRGLGVGAWTGRLPIAICGLLLCVATYFLVRRYEGERAAWLSVLITATCPFFMLNSQQMLGEAPALLGQTLVASAAFGWAMTVGAAARSWLWLLLLIGAAALSTFASGVLLGPLPPLAALALVLVIVQGYRTPILRNAGRWVVLVTVVVLIVNVVQAVVVDAATYSVWLGGASLGGEPPTFDNALERVFHSFAPWSALGLVALASALFMPSRGAPARDEDPRFAFRLMLVLWAVFAYASLTVFTSRYGSATYLAIAAIAPLVAIYVNDVLENAKTRWPEIVVTVLLLGLLIRDYALYPASPLEGLAPSDMTVPKVFNPWIGWTVLFGIFTIVTVLFLSGPGKKPDRRAPVRWIGAQWNRNWVFKLWILFFGTVMGTCVVFGLLCFVFPLPISSIAIRVGQVLLFVPFGLALVVVATPYVAFFYGKLGRWSLAPLLIAGLAVGMYTSFRYQPALSQHLSPRNVYDRYEKLADPEIEPLASYQIETDAAKYYTDHDIRVLKSAHDVTEYLAGDSRRWLIIPKNKLGFLNRDYRRKNQRHLFVADARSARVLLIASQPVPDLKNENHLAKSVISKAPKPQFPLNARFDHGVELLGYDLKSRKAGYVGAGQRFTLTWYWRATKRIPRSYQVFVHIDGHSGRVNGDHVPVDGTYKTSQWDPGDVIVDKQELTMPGHFGAGEYVLHVGLFAGKKRLAIKEGTNDGDDRLRAGTILVK